MKLSVLMITYNHEKYIAQALDSVLMQEVNFDYEIVIGEDCSTDKTRRIVQDFRDMYPDRIRLLLPEKNLGMMENFIQTYQSCQGEYIAILEGDDYWTSSLKLQKQVDLLDNNLGSSICFHNAEIHYEDNKRPNELMCRKDIPIISTIVDLLYENYMPTPSVVIRNNVFGKFPSWFATLQFGDWPLYILNAQYGNIYYIEETLATYRVHSGGVWSSDVTDFKRQIDKLKAQIDFYLALEKHFRGKYSAILHDQVSKCHLSLAGLYKKTGNIGISLIYIARGFIAYPRFNNIVSIINIFINSIKSKPSPLIK